MLLKHDQIGLKILDWSSISRVVLNQRVTTNDPKGLCCSTNYSAAWDLDDELIVFATDNLFCNDTVETLLKLVLDPERKWENLTQAINRVHRQDIYISTPPTNINCKKSGCDALILGLLRRICTNTINNKQAAIPK